MSNIPREVIEEIINKNDILELVSQYINLKKAGQTSYKGLCPFHNEKTPSFFVDTKRQIYKCFGCGKGGNAIGFLMGIENISFIEALKKLAEFARIDISAYFSVKSEIAGKYDAYYKVNDFAMNYFLKELKNSIIAQNYLNKRKISKNILHDFKIGYAPDKWDGFLEAAGKNGIDLKIAEELGLIIKGENGKYYDRFRNRIIFPIFNISGFVIGFGGRAIEEGSGAKYINSPESEIYYKGKTFYGIESAIKEMRNTQKVIICEGYMDLLSFRQFGFNNSVAVLGTGLTEEQGELLKRYVNEVYLVYDGDQAGRNAAVRGLKSLFKADLKVRIVILPDNNDPDSFLKEKGKDEMLLLLENSPDAIDYLIGVEDIEELDLNIRENKLKVITELISEYNDKIKKDLYLTYLSNIFKVSKGILNGYMNSYIEKNKRNEVKEGKVEEVKGKEINLLQKELHNYEMELFKIILNNNEVFYSFFSKINREILITELGKEIFDDFVAIIREKKSCSQEDFLMLEKWCKYHSSFAQMEYNYTQETARKGFLDLVNKFMIYHLDEEIDKIQSKIKIEFDSLKVKSLLKELDLVKRHKIKLLSNKNLNGVQ